MMRVVHKRGSNPYAAFNWYCGFCFRVKVNLMSNKRRAEIDRIRKKCQTDTTKISNEDE